MRTMIWRARSRWRAEHGLKSFGGERISSRIFSGLFSSFLSRVQLALSSHPRLMLEYARVMSLDRGAMSYEESPQEDEKA